MHAPSSPGPGTYPQRDVAASPRRPLRRDTVSLLLAEPAIAAAWHPEKNAPWGPGDVARKSNLYAWWHCSEGHEWRARINNRVAGRTGCPKCVAVARTRTIRALKAPITETHRWLAAQWHPTKNGSPRPDQVTAGSNREAWWACPKGHPAWAASPHSRATTARGCPRCGRTGDRGGSPRLRRSALDVGTLAARCPVIAAQWHPTKNAPLTPFDVSAMTPRKAWWRATCGYEWEASVARQVARFEKYPTADETSICPRCSGRHLDPETNSLAVTHPAAASHWHPSRNGSLTPRDVSLGTARPVWWLCSEGHEWQAQVRYWKPGTKIGFGGCTVCRDLAKAGAQREREESLERARQDRLKRVPADPLPEWVRHRWHPTRRRSSSRTAIGAGLRSPRSSSASTVRASTRRSPNGSAARRPQGSASCTETLRTRPPAVPRPH